MTAKQPCTATQAPLAGDEVEYRPFDASHWANRVMLAAGDALRVYHRHRVEGVEHLQAALARGPVILVGNHVLDVVDPLMLNVAIYRELGRVLRFIGHGNLFFTVPGLRTLAPIWGLIPNRHAALADTVVREEGALMLYPGSGTEAILRSYRREPYRLKWFGKLGFVDLALRHDASLLFVAALGIDELYYQTDVPTPAALVRATNAGDDAYYRGARLQLGAAGPHILPAILPLPVRVTHVISAPLALDRSLDPKDRDGLGRAQLRLWSEAQAFLDDALARRPSDPVDTLCRTGIGMLQRLGV